MAAKAAEEAVLAEPSQPTKKKGGLKFFILLLVYALFLLLGAAMFMHLEFSVQEEVIVIDSPEWIKIKGYIQQVTSDQGGTTVKEEMGRAAWLQERCPLINNATLYSLFHPNTSAATLPEVELLCGEFVRNVTLSERLVYAWSFIDALYFSMTVTTTIGYGHIVPTGAAGKVMCMLYAVVGVPLTGILLAFTSDVFGEKVYAMYRSKLSGQKQRSRVFIVAATVLYLLLGFVVFLFLPAIVFVYVEGWSYLDSIYYAFITLTTIGFGDIVTGRTMESGVEHTCYQFLVIIWITTSLGYWVMVANFITRVLRSKRLHASLIRRAKLLKDIMDRQNDPVFLPQRSKYTMNFMMQLSSMLAIDSEDTAHDLELNDSGENPPLAGGKGRSASMPIGIPGIASLFNMPPSSPSGLNTQICKCLRRLEGKWFTGCTEAPHKRKGLTSPGRMCLMGGALACATLMLAGAEVDPSQCSSEKSPLLCTDCTHTGGKRKPSMSRTVFHKNARNETASHLYSDPHVYNMCPQDTGKITEEKIYELLAAHPDAVIILCTHGDARRLSEIAKYQVA